MAMQWCVPAGLLLDIYDLMINSPRFYSQRQPYGIKYQQMADHLEITYRVVLSERQLRYLVRKVRQR